MKSFICSTHNTVYILIANGLIFDLYFTLFQVTNLMLYSMPVESSQPA